MFISRVTLLEMRGNVIAEAGAIGRLTSTVLKSSARKEIMNDGESKMEDFPLKVLSLAER